MAMGIRGTFVISSVQTETDGAAAAPLAALSVGSQWRWWGEVVRVDGPAELLLLHDQETETERRRRAARMVRRLMGAAIAGRDPLTEPEGDSQPQHGFVVTDGHETWAVTIIEVASSSSRLLMFSDGMPPADTDLWVIRRSVEAPQRAPAEATGVICFTPGTFMTTPDGPRLIEALRPGDRISTRDDGAQQILWTGRRRMTGARLYATPSLRPVRIRAGAMGEDRPDHDLIVSPGHRMLVRGPAARALFNAAEVLVTARDLLNGRTVVTETAMPEVTYIHLMTERHQVIWANGLETESFHPANAHLDQIDPSQRAVLLAMMPELAEDPYSYGSDARRSLTAPEAAILRRSAA